VIVLLDCDGDVRALKESGEDKDSHHGKCHSHFDGNANGQPDSGADAGASSILQAALSRKLANDRPDEGTKYNSGETKEQADDGADQRAEDGPLGRAESLGPEHGCPEVDGIRKNGEHAQDNQCAGADVSKIFSPGCDKKPGKYQR
jgi:hypothetical protein